ncbi:MAG: hypothetical protein PUG60_11840 [Lachnospiraceae bacterium]|nr:hypothetical protein [Lachnospiraceae bacterium]MDY4970033.1 hypothetical protein [Lachnospiraceae bacterium]
MTYWISIYSHAGKKWSSHAESLNAAQFTEMDYLFRSACQGMESSDIRKIYEQHRKSSLFYHLSKDTGLRYRFEINKRKGTAVIRSIDVDYARISSSGKGRAA